MNTKTELRDLLKNSVIAGVPQVIGVKGLFRKTLRVLVLLGCLLGFVYQTSRFLNIYWTYPTVMDIEVSFPDEVQIPAVSVCNYNGIKASVFCESFPTFCSPAKNYSQFCSENFYLCDSKTVVGNKSIPVVGPYNLPDLNRSDFRDMGMKKEDVVESCKIVSSAKSFSCSENIRWVSIFDSVGLPNNCYVLNSFWGNSTGTPLTVKAKAYMLVSIKAETADHFYTGTAHSMSVALHNPFTTVNPFHEGFALQPCTNYYVYISKVVRLLLPPPYSTNCTNYVEMWKHRNGKGPLTKRHCREECLLNISMLYDQCVDPFFITYPNTEKACHKAADSEWYFRKCAHRCRRACVSEELKFEIEEHSRLDDKANRKRNNECLSVVVFAFNRMEQKTFRYFPKYESVELFSYIGGYMGIWLGISLLAVSDVLETLLIFYKCIISKVNKRFKAKKAKSEQLFTSHPRIRTKLQRNRNTLRIV